MKKRSFIKCFLGLLGLTSLAARPASGGLIGSGSPSFIRRRGEVVFTKEQFEQLMKGIKPSRCEVINVIDPAAIDKHLKANPGAVMKVIARNRHQIKAALGIRG